MQNQIDQLDSENNLFKMDIKHLKKENEQMSEALDSESKAHTHLEQLKIEH